jgi:hypothetical protein
MSHILNLRWLPILRLSPSHCWECVLDWCHTHIITRVLGTLTSALWGNKLWVSFRRSHIWLDPQDILYKTLILRLVRWRQKTWEKRGRKGKEVELSAMKCSSIALLWSVLATSALVYLHSHCRVCSECFHASSSHFIYVFFWPFDAFLTSFRIKIW